MKNWPPLGRAVLFHVLEEGRRCLDLQVVAAVLLGQVAGIEFEVRLADDLRQGLAERGAEALVGEGVPAFEVLAPDAERQRFDQGMIEGLGVARASSVRLEAVTSVSTPSSRSETPSARPADAHAVAHPAQAAVGPDQPVLALARLAGAELPVLPGPRKAGPPRGSSPASVTSGRKKSGGRPVIFSTTGEK